MNPYAIIAAITLAIGLFASGVTVGEKWEEGRNALEKNHIAEAVDAANAASAKAIAEIKPKYTTIRNEVQREIQTHHEYTDCKLSTDGLRYANTALNGTKPVDSGKLPSAEAPSQ